MVELDGSLGLPVGNRPVWFPSASGGNRPPCLSANTKPIPSCVSQHPPSRHSAIMDGMGLSSLRMVGASKSFSGPRSGPSRPEPVAGVESETEACAGPVMWGGPGAAVGSAREPGPWGRGLGLGPRFWGSVASRSPRGCGPDQKWSLVVSRAGWADRLRPGQGPKSLYR
jgi:hypothetical protein